MRRALLRQRRHLEAGAGGARGGEASRGRGGPARLRPGRPVAAQQARVEISGIVPISPAGFGHSTWTLRLLRFHWLNPLLFQPVVPMPAYRWIAGRTFGVVAAGGSPMVPGVAGLYASQYRHPPTYAARWRPSRR